MAAFDLDEAEGTPESSGNPGRSPTELETDNEKLRSTGPPITAQMLEQKSAEPGNKNPEETIPSDIENKDQQGNLENAVYGAAKIPVDDGRQVDRIHGANILNESERLFSPVGIDDSPQGLDDIGNRVEQCREVNTASPYTKTSHPKTKFEVWKSVSRLSINNNSKVSSKKREQEEIRDF